nr:PAS domain-containing sensor histidine kinase [uncultured Draconibacterium sp.]
MTKARIGENEIPKLKKSAEQFYRISDHVPIVLYDYILHPDGSNQFQYVSSSCEEILELTEEAMLNDSMVFWSRVHQDDIEMLRLEDERTTRENSIFKVEFRYITKSGKTKWLQASSNPSKLLYGNTSLYSGYCLDITEKKNLENDLKQELETKDKFLSILSHDIRTPLGSMMAFSELLHEKLVKQDYTDLLEYSAIIKNTSELTFHFFDNLLAWGRSQKGINDFNPEYYSISGIINEVMGLLNAAVLQKNIQLEFDIDKNIEVFVDKNMIKTVLRNLLSNAVKFTADYGKIRVSTKVSSHTLEISIQDSGTGMSKDRLDNLLKLDKIVSEKGTRGEKGSGLGLILCNEFVQKHNGTIKAESEPNMGSIFTIELPLRQNTIAVEKV